MSNKKLTASVVAVAAAAALLLGGTFAWQSTNQTALNEASDIVNPGGRLHDDFDGTNKDVYVENFAEDEIFARIQLSEYFEVIMNYGVEGASVSDIVAGGRDEDTDEYIYDVHYFDEDVENATDAFWTWKTDGETVFMPTFNKNKDSLVADINGTYIDAVGGISNRDGTQYTDYVTYENGDTKVDTEIYDGDTNTIDEVGSDFDNLADYSDNVVLVENVEHTAKYTSYGHLISMAEWLDMIEADGGYDADLHGNYWVYDTDGWVYWSAPIAAGEATGLLLDEVSLNGVMDDTWYYAINVTAQFVTANDVGKTDSTGFYDLDNGSAPSDNAAILLSAIGVDMSGEEEDGGEEDGEETGSAIATISAYYAGGEADGENLTLTRNIDDSSAFEWYTLVISAYDSDGNPVEDLSNIYYTFDISDVSITDGYTAELKDDGINVFYGEGNTSEYSIWVDNSDGYIGIFGMYDTSAEEYQQRFENDVTLTYTLTISDSEGDASVTYNVTVNVTVGEEEEEEEEIPFAPVGPENLSYTVANNGTVAVTTGVDVAITISYEDEPSTTAASCTVTFLVDGSSQAGTAGTDYSYDASADPDTVTLYASGLLDSSTQVTVTFDNGGSYTVTVTGEPTRE